VIESHVNRAVSVDEFVDILSRSTLGERRPVHDRERMARMVGGANVMVTAWHAGTLVGVSRALTDFAYVCYLADLAVDRAFQRTGIGRELVARTQVAAGVHAMIVLLAAPAAAAYYARLGFVRHERCWILPAGQPVSAGSAEADD
jgi:predicted N-acetyltransferase YhbS